MVCLSDLWKITDYGSHAGVEQGMNDLVDVETGDR